MSITEWMSLVMVGALVLLVMFGGEKNEYPPKDERGRPMVPSFSSRGGRFCWVRDPRE